MSIPHDYDDGRLHSRGNSRHYIEPDYIANEADDQLPLLSTVGRGPRGAGLTIGNLVNEDGEFSFGIYSDLTGEQIMQTPNLSAGTIAVSAMPTEPVPGETVEMTVSVSQGGKVSRYVVPIPAGAHGSRFFAVTTELEYGGKGHAYQVPIDDLMVYGLKREVWDSWPIPRVNDMCIFKAGTALGFGTIETVQDGMVTFTSQVMFDVMQHITIGENGNWVVEGEDTGVAAQGPRGEQGPAGPKGDKGDKGDPDGLPARMTVGTVDEGDHPAFTVHLVDETTNTYSVNVTLPKGEDGKSININGGIYKLPDLPSFDDTPVNDAFIVNDYDEADDHRYDLYIRGKEPVRAEDGGPWTVVEDWQGVQGFSTRVLTGHNIDPDETIRIPKAEADTAFTPHIGILDGDLCTDGKYLGVIGSAMDDSGDYTVTFVAKLQIEWDDIIGKPVLSNTDSISLKDIDGSISADLNISTNGYSNADVTTWYEQYTFANLKHEIDENGVMTHRLEFDYSQFKNDDLNHVIQLSDSVVESLGKADTAIQETELTAAIAAEADAREKADKLLETEIDGKLDAADLIAGANITITPESETGHVTIAATGGGGGDVSVATTETAGIVKPDGTTVTVDPDGTIHSVGGGGGGNSYVLPVATNAALGGVKASAQILVTGDGAMSLAQNSVTSDNIADGTITEDKIAGSVLPTFNTGTIGGSVTPHSDYVYLSIPISNNEDRTIQNNVNLSIQAATSTDSGIMSAADKAKLDSLPDSFTAPAVDIVRTTTHSTSYTKDTLEIVTDTSGKVTEMWFVTAD